MGVRIDLSSILILGGLGLGFYYYKTRLEPNKKPSSTPQITVGVGSNLANLINFLRTQPYSKPKFYSWESERLI